jgi:WD40 repeat protein
VNLTKHWAGSLDDYVIDLAWSADGSMLAAASTSGPVTVFAQSDGATKAKLPGHDGGTNCIGWKNSQDAGSQLLATGGQDGAVKMWDAAAGQHLATTNLGNAWVDHLAWRPATAGSESNAHLLFAAAGKNLSAIRPDGAIAHAFKPAPKTISALAWEPAGGCAAVSYFGGVCLWDADDFVVQKEFAYGNGINALVWSPDGRWLVSGNQDPSVHLWIPAEDIELQMSGYEGKVKDLAFDHTSRWLATGGGKDCCVWDCSGAGPEGREPNMLPHDATLCATAFQNQHGLLATASRDGVVQLWSPERKQPLRATVKMPSAATKLRWSPDDRLLAIGSEQGVVYVLKAD